MQTTMRILGWQAEGLRCPDHEVDCCVRPGQCYHISLIQMPNGTGKTTTLTLLRAALSGSGKDFSRQEILEFRKRNSSNRSGKFELRLAYNQRRLTVIMRFDFEEGSISYFTTQTQAGGQKSGFDPPFALRSFMNKEFVNFYVFDGELAEHLLDRDLTHAEKAVETLFQLNLLKMMRTQIKGYWFEVSKWRGGNNARGKLDRLTNRLQRWRQRLTNVRIEKATLERELHELQKSLGQQRERYDAEINKETERARRVQVAEQDVVELQKKMLERSKGILDQMRDPYALSAMIATRMFNFKSGLDKVKLPESAAREFFDELVEEPECVCGRPIDDEVRIHIRDHAQRYLGSDEVVVLNEIKSAISDAVGLSLNQPAEELTQAIGVLSMDARHYHAEKTTLEELKREAEEADPEVKKAKEVCDELGIKVDKKMRELEKYEEKDSSGILSRLETGSIQHIYSVDTLEEGERRLQDKVAETSSTVGMLEKQKVLDRIMDQSLCNARMAIADDIRDQTNDLIAELMPFNDVRISSIDGCLQLSGRSGSSVGETLSVGYAFLSTLFNRSEHHELPFVVDSPANPIDFAIRDTIGELVPRLSGQFIGFMISSERERFLSGIERSAESEIQYITLFRKGAHQLESAARTSASCVQTVDGFQVAGEEFFNKFQEDTEEG